MWIDTPVFKEDMEQIIHADFIPWENLNGKTIFITGATGLIGYYLVSALIYRNIVAKSNIRILALVRNEQAALEQFQEQRKADPGHLYFVQGSLECFPEIPDKIDYIVHAGGPTASRYFVEKPVETILVSINGMLQILKLANVNKIGGLVYLSSMEIYGTYSKSLKIQENSPSYLDVMNVRSSYPESKRLCENLCSSFFQEYRVPAKVIRLTQTFGPGIKEDDQRVFAQFIRAYLNNKNICLLTSGKTKRSYLYLSDAVTSILCVLLKGKPGEAYNAANETTYCSISEMADFIATEIAHGTISVEHKFSSEEELKQYLPTAYTDLNTQKLRGLGWRWHIDLKEAFLRSIR